MIEEEKIKEKGTREHRRKVYVSVDKHSLNSGSNQAAHSTRGDAHSLSDKHLAESEADIADAHHETPSKLQRKIKVGQQQH